MHIDHIVISTDEAAELANLWADLFDGPVVPEKEVGRSESHENIIVLSVLVTRCLQKFRSFA